PTILLAYWTLDLVWTASEVATLDSLEALARAKAEGVDRFIDDRTTDSERVAQLVAPEVVAAIEAAAASTAESGAEATPLPELRDAEAIVEGAGAVPEEHVAPDEPAPDP